VAVGSGAGYPRDNAAGARERGPGGGQRQRGGDEDAGPPREVKRTVYVLVDGKPQPREVITGITDGRLTEITGGTLKPGELVITGIAGQNPGQTRQGMRGPRIL
jgi:HlyD family secretion protein